MATAFFFHAHPDDEAIATGVTMAKMASEGHRVVLVTATKGELGLIPEDGLNEGETLSDRRVKELEAAARILGVARGEFLGYRDSGMAGDETNNDPESFWQADVEEAAQRLANLLIEENAEIITYYDEHGGYGHPDHIQVHRVGKRAAEIAKTPRVFIASPNRDRALEMFAKAREMGIDTPDPGDFEVDSFGSPESVITTAVDVSDFLALKRKAMEAHPSQIAETSFFLTLPEDVYAQVWGTEWYIKQGEEPTRPFKTSLLD